MFSTSSPCLLWDFTVLDPWNVKYLMSVIVHEIVIFLELLMMVQFFGISKKTIYGRNRKCVRCLTCWLLIRSHLWQVSWYIGWKSLSVVALRKVGRAETLVPETNNILWKDGCYSSSLHQWSVWILLQRMSDCHSHPGKSVKCTHWKHIWS